MRASAILVAKKHGGHIYSVRVSEISGNAHENNLKMNYLDTLKRSNRERYSRKLWRLYGKSEMDKENSCQELDPYYTMTTTLFAHQMADTRMLIG